MGRKQVKDKKLPSSYPQMAFRVSKLEKERLAATIEIVQEFLNKKRPEGAPFINKNDVIILALNDGLKRLKKF